MHYVIPAPITYQYLSHSHTHPPLQKQVKEAEYGTDVHTVRAEYERHQKEHKVIDQFQGNVEKCREAEVRFHGEELKIYGERMTILQKVGELTDTSNVRLIGIGKKGVPRFGEFCYRCRLPLLPSLRATFTQPGERTSLGRALYV